MMHAFTAGAWNPALMKAGFAALLTDGTDSDGLTAEGGLTCGKSSDAATAEMLALQGVGLLLKVYGEDETAAVHVTEPELYERTKAMQDKPLVRLFRDGTEFTDYFGDGSFLHVVDPSAGGMCGLFKECMARVMEMARAKAGLGAGSAGHGTAQDGYAEEDRAADARAVGEAVRKIKGEGGTDHGAGTQ